MARIIPSGLVQDIVGSAGAYTYSKWRGLHYLRLKAASVSNPQTEAQQKIRGRLSAGVDCWSDLTPEQRALWAEYAQGLGSARDAEKMVGYNGVISPSGKLMSGFNAYIGVNGRLASCNAGPVEVPSLYEVTENLVITEAKFYPPSPVFLGVTCEFPITTKDYYLVIWMDFVDVSMHKYIIAFVFIGAGAIAHFENIPTVRVGHGDEIEEVPWEAWLGPYDPSNPNWLKVIGRVQARFMTFDGAI